MRNIFGIGKKSGGLRIDSFFLETALVLPVFAICCCAVLRMLGAAVQRSEKETIYASAVSCCESWCELYTATGDLERSAEGLFGNDAADKSRNVDGYLVRADSNCRYRQGSDTVRIVITEDVTECTGDGYVYGQLFTSHIHILWDGGEMYEEASRYVPYPVLITLEGGEDG